MRSLGTSFRIAGLLAALVACASGCSTEYKDKAPVTPASDGGAADVPARADAAACAPGAAKNRPAGQACSCDAECASGFCTEGVCCDAACRDVCRSCTVADHVGTCTAIPAGSPPVEAAQCGKQAASTCGRDGTCDGSGKCRSYADGSVCAPGRCDTGAVVDGKVCKNGVCTATGERTVCAPFTCDAAKGACSDVCAMTMANGTCAGKDAGMACGSATECKSQFCVDGVCCATSCTAGCMQCNLPGKLGACSPVPKDAVDPHGVCKDDGVAGCGTNGKCTGSGGCAKYGGGAMCKPSSCTGATLMPANTCDGNGACLAGTAVDCAPYVCDVGACKTACATDMDCVPPATCSAGVCGNGLLSLGRACQMDGQCASGHCADGVCCNEGCDGKCRFCASTSFLGRCVNVAAGTVDPRAARGEKDPNRICVDAGASSCGTNGTCNGAGGCAVYAAGTICKGDSCDAAANLASPAWVCNGTGSCMASTQQSCAPYTCNGTACGTACSASTQCSAPNVCTSNSCGTKPNGALCANDGECTSNVCAQGVCCSTACKGVCFSCALPGTQGVCAAVPAGGADPNGTCKDEGVGSCGNDGTCNGSGSCRKYPAGAVCTQPSCANGTAVSAGTCNGLGSCNPGQPRLCDPYVCNAEGTGCYEACTTAVQCAAPKPCAGGSCGAKALGGTCTNGGDCQSGNCVDGVCCDTACKGLCQTCALAGSLGTCSNVPAGVADTDGGCTATDASTCGTNGLCNGAGACQFWSAATVCRPASCPAGTNAGTKAATCDGAGGACPAGASVSCGSFLCDATRNTCKSSCTTATRAQDCFGDAACVSKGSAFICGDPKVNGSPCVSGAECANGQCVGGTCCASASCGTCQSCSTGACAPVAAGTSDARCAPTNGDVCTSNGVCGAGGACAATPSGTGCGSTCTADGKQQNLACDGAGTCKALGAPVSCGAYKCAGTGCIKKCATTADCAAGHSCKGGSGMCK